MGAGEGKQRDKEMGEKTSYRPTTYIYLFIVRSSYRGVMSSVNFGAWFVA